MTIKDCIDIVDNNKPNTYTIKEKVMWLSFIEGIIINEVLKTHEGYDGRYDDFEGYSEEKLSVTLIVPSPYDRLYTQYLKMKIDEENGETARYNNSAALYNTYITEYKKYYNKTHMPLNATNRKNIPLPNKTTVGLSDAEYENIKKDLTYILTEYFDDSVSQDKLYKIVTEYAQNNVEMLKGKDGKNGTDGKDGYTPRKGVDYFDGQPGKSFTYGDFTPEQLDDLRGKPFRYEDFTASQLAELKGTKGDDFTYEDFTEEQLEKLKGKSFSYEDFTPEQLEELKGENGKDGKTAHPYREIYNYTLEEGGATYLEFYTDLKYQPFNLEDVTVFIYIPESFTLTKPWSIYANSNDSGYCMTYLNSGSASSGTGRYFMARAEHIGGTRWWNTKFNKLSANSYNGSIVSSYDSFKCESINRIYINIQEAPVGTVVKVYGREVTE